MEFSCTFCRGSQHLRKPRFTLTIQKTKCSPVTGEVLLPVSQDSQASQFEHYFSDCKGIFIMRFFPLSRGSNHYYCRQVLQRVRDRIRETMSESNLIDSTWQWAGPHWNFSAENFGRKKRDFARNPPYSLNLAICVFFFFPRIKFQLRKCRSQHVLKFR